MRQEVTLFALQKNGGYVLLCPRATEDLRPGPFLEPQAYYVNT